MVCSLPPSFPPPFPPSSHLPPPLPPLPLLPSSHLLFTQVCHLNTPHDDSNQVLNVSVTFAEIQSYSGAKLMNKKLKLIIIS